MKVNNILADSITRILNSTRNNQPEVILTKSHQIITILTLLRKHGYVRNFNVEKSFIRVTLKYSKDQSVITNIKYYSPLNVNNTVSFKQLKYLIEQKPCLSGLSLFILSTPLGIISDYDCLKNRIGGKLLLMIT